MPADPHAAPLGPRSLPLAVDMPDPYGQAALLLVESLIHVMTERSILSVADAVEVVETAADVQYEIADVADGAGSAMRRAAALLMAMADSFRQDLEPVDGDDVVQ